IYDPLRDRMIVFGGNTNIPVGDPELNDVWALSLSAGTWSALFPTGTPPHGRRDHTAIYDPVRGRMIVFGGYYYDGIGHDLNDVWALNLSGAPSWSRLFPSGIQPTPVEGATAVYDPLRDRMLAFGGDAQGGLSNDTWALSLQGGPTWSKLAPS